jgi:hypothetical protein
MFLKHIDGSRFGFFGRDSSEVEPSYVAPCPTVKPTKIKVTTILQDSGEQ